MDASLDQVGLGLWQVPPILSLALVQAFAAVGFISSVFINQRSDFDNKFDSTLLVNVASNITYAPKSDTDNTRFSAYQTYDYVHSIINLMYYDFSKFLEGWSIESTLSSDFNFYNERAWMSPLYQMVFVVGVMLGDLGGGLSDKYGRVFIIHFATFWCTVCQLMMSFSPYFSLIIFCRLITGISYSLINTPVYNLVMETTPKKYRAIICLLIGIFYYISAILLSISAYFIRNWRQLNLCNSIYLIGLSVSVIFLKRSPHWLLQNGRVKESIEVINSAYECNNRNSPPKDLFIYLKDGESEKEITKGKNEPPKRFYEVIYSLFETRNMRIISIIHPTVFTFIGFIYYGIPLNANNFTANPYLYLIIVEAMEILPSLLGSHLVNKIGNINSITILSVIAGICMTLSIVPNYLYLSWISIALAKMCIGLIFLVCWMLSSQLFPTSLRSTGFGMSNFACHLGSLIASYMFDTVARYYPLVPNLVSVVLCILSASLVKLLPETCGEPLCDDIKDIENRNTKPFSCKLGQCISNNSSKA